MPTQTKLRTLYEWRWMQDGEIRFKTSNRRAVAMLKRAAAKRGGTVERHIAGYSIPLAALFGPGETL